MLSAIVDDLTALPGCQVFTTLDHRLALDHQLTLGSRVIEPSCNANVETCSVEVVDTADAERQAFDRLAASCDATLIIAPETDGMLAQRVRRVAALGGTALNCLPAAIELGGDKLRLAEHLSSHKIATIATLPADLNDEPWKLLGTACVLKPRDGAGSWLTFGIPDRDSAAWHRATVALIGAGLADRTILQPWIAGQALSVGCLCHSSGRVDLLPIARQHLSHENFQYLGGQIPADLSRQEIAAIERIVMRTCETIEGLRGYIGIDILLPDVEPHSPLVVEINPRLTTSYVGYRQLCVSNIAARILRGDATESPLSWKANAVVFRADGNSH